MTARERTPAMAEAEMTEMPTVDLGAFLAGTAEARANTAQQVDAICRRTGFLIIANHRVSPAVMADAWSLARQFFDLPIEMKLRSTAPGKGCPRGYFPEDTEALAKSLGVDTPADRKESFSCGPLRFPDVARGDPDLDFHYGDNLWPGEPPGFRSAWIAYFQAMETLAADILQLFAAALGLPEDYFVPFHTHHISALRGINYPGSTSELRPGQWRAGEHSDYGSLTILKPDPDVPGLEIRLPTGRWVSAPKVKDAFIINVGDMMARWTNDRWVSTRHRVAVPENRSGSGSNRRQSIAFFHNTNFDADIQCIETCVDDDATPNYTAVKAGAYLIESFRAARDV